MPENDSNNPVGAVPPKPVEAGKVQPKKETVRINLPPKASSPTIKIPTPVAAAPAAAAPAAPVAAPAAAPAAAGRPASAAAPAAPAMGAAPMAGRPAPIARAAVATGTGMVENALGMAAALVAVLAVVRVVLLLQTFE